MSHVCALQTRLGKHEAGKNVSFIQRQTEFEGGIPGSRAGRCWKEPLTPDFFPALMAPVVSGLLSQRGQKTLVPPLSHGAPGQPGLPG